MFGLNTSGRVILAWPGHRVPQSLAFDNHEDKIRSAPDQRRLHFVRTSISGAFTCVRASTHERASSLCTGTYSYVCTVQYLLCPHVIVAVLTMDHSDSPPARRGCPLFLAFPVARGPECRTRVPKQQALFYCSSGGANVPVTGVRRWVSAHRVRSGAGGERERERQKETGRGSERWR